MPIRHSSLLTHNSPEDVLTFGTVEKKCSFAFLLLTRLDSVRILEYQTYFWCTFRIKIYSIYYSNGKNIWLG